MSSNRAKNSHYPVKVKGKSIFHGYGPFPPIPCSLNLFDSERGMLFVGEEENKLFLKSLLNFVR